MLGAYEVKLQSLQCGNYSVHLQNVAVEGLATCIFSCTSVYLAVGMIAFVCRQVLFRVVLSVQAQAMCQ